MKFKLKKYRFFFFDFDGVIVDSLKVKAAAFEALFKGYGRDIQRKVLEYHLKNGGVSRFDKFKYFYREFLGRKITPEKIKELDRKYSELVVNKVIRARYIKGAMKFIKRARNEEKSCFLVSATPEKEISLIVRKRGIEDLFVGVVGSPGKKKDNLRGLLSKHKIQAEEALYFGDAKSDYEAAVGNSVDFIGVCVNNDCELAEIKNIKKIKDFAGL